MVLGRGHPMMGCGQMKVWLGRGPITYPTGKPFGFWKLVETGTSFYIGTERIVELVERKEQLALHASEWTFRYLRRKMAVGVTDGLWRISPESSSNFMDIFAESSSNLWYLATNELVCISWIYLYSENIQVLHHMYLWRKGECQKPPPKCMSEKQNWRRINTTVIMVHTIWLR